KKSDLTGSVTSVQSEGFVKGVATNALQLLSGKVSGVNVSQTNSEPGTNMNIIVDRKSTRLNSSHVKISYAVFCLKKKNTDVTKPVIGYKVVSVRLSNMPQSIIEIYYEVTR